MTSWLEERPADLELGHDVRLWFTGWHPNRELNPHSAHLPDVERFGAYYEHPAATETGICAGGVTFDGPVAREVTPAAAIWQVESWEPLTLSPSLLCQTCGHHGFIRAGQWIPA